MRGIGCGVMIAALAAALVAGAWVMARADEDASPPAPLRVGVFDSRAIAVAFASSDLHDAEMQALRKRHEAAKAAGDEKTVAAIEEEAKAHQAAMHLQGFGRASVLDILAKIEAKLPDVAAEAGVDLLVSKWDVAWQREDVDVVDVTWPLAEVFEPDERVRGWIEQVLEKEPVPHGEIRAHEGDE